ncbi:MAG: hydroxyacid dehydrogenase [Myxococcales bacterium]|nr:hydroxyacid dehydrogenase [Myxococcales bacterium]
MRVLIADKLPDEARSRLQGAGFEVVVDAGLGGEALARALAEHAPDVVIVRSTKLTADHFAAAPSVQLVVRAGAGVNTIDITAASARGVFVANCPGMNAVAVAELTLGHLLNADRRIADNVADLRAGRWQKKVYSKARGLKGRTLGVIGCGDIGKAVIARARAFDMKVVAWSPSLDDAKAAKLKVERAASLEDVAGRADAVSVHVALNPATRGLIGRAFFDAMRPGAIFLNTSRGEVVDEDALAAAVRDKGIRAGLDVFCDEPAGDGEWASPLAALEGVYGTHHIGASTDEAQNAVAFEACRVVETWAATGTAPNTVNLAKRTQATHLLVARHADRVGVLAGILDQLREARINVQTMENVIFAGPGAAACARIQVGSRPDDALLARLTEDDAVYDVKVVALPG